MSKYSKLPDNVLKIKLEKFVTNDLSDEMKERIKSVLDPFDRCSVELLCIEVEKSIADGKKLLEEFRKNEAAKLALIEDINDNDLKEVKKEFTPIVSPNEWTAIKNSMGVPLMDDNDIAIYADLKSQFIDRLSNSSMKLFKAKYYDKSKFSEAWRFKFVNLNSGFSKEFEPLNGCCFTCFRLSVDPESQECIYESWWIVNSNDSMDIILNTDYEYFEWTDLTNSDRSEFSLEFMKSNDLKYLSESYLH